MIIAKRHVTDLKILLQLVSCEWFDFEPFMPADPLILTPLFELFQKKSYSLEIQELFYNFGELQASDAGRKFLLKFGANFAQKTLAIDLFSSKEQEDVILAISKSPIFRIEYLSSKILRVISMKASNPFSRNGLWNFIGLPIFIEYFPFIACLEVWVEQVKPCVEFDDLLFYRLAFLAHYHVNKFPEFAILVKKILKNSSSNNFRLLVLDYYSLGGSFVVEKMAEISDSILTIDPKVQATLHFEHVLAAIELKLKVSIGDFTKLFQRFTPSQVSPFLCRSLLDRIDYNEFPMILKDSLMDWKDLYYRTSREFSYFPAQFLLIEKQLNLWRRRNLRIEASPTMLNSLPTLYLNHPETWASYINEEYVKIKTKIAVKEDKFTFIDCCASQHLITAFMKGSIVECLLYGIDLPKFKHMSQASDCLNIEGFKCNLARPCSINDICIMNLQQSPTVMQAMQILRCIQNISEEWQIPPLFYVPLEIN